MNPLRRAAIRRILLGVLDDCGGLLLPESTLLIHLNVLCKPVSTLSEMKDVLNAMEAASEVVQLPTMEGIKVKITDQGRAAKLE